jgi:WD40 repeat protein
VAVGELEGRPVVISASADETVRVWDLATGRPIGDPFTGHTSGVTVVVVVGELEGRPVVISASADRTVRMWQLASERPIENDVASQPWHVGNVTITPDEGPIDGTHLGITIKAGNENIEPAATVEIFSAPLSMRVEDYQLCVGTELGLLVLDLPGF